MNGETSDIRRHLQQVSELRAAREADSSLASRVSAIKRYQHARFERDYAGLLQSARHGAAARFFLDDLYGPVDFAERDAQFGRAVPGLRRLLPADVMHMVAALAQLHALSEDLDQEMAQALSTEQVSDASYRAAWRKVDRSADRKRQIALVLEIGIALDRHARSPLLAATLKLMRGPAKAAGMSELQSFLERGMGAFAAMRGAQEFLETVTDRERHLIAELFESP